VGKKCHVFWPFFFYRFSSRIEVQARLQGELMALKTLAMVLLVCVASYGCESAEDDKVAQAQACLDRATDATSADECSAKVDGVTGPRAAIIRCSAIWIGQGFTTNSTKFLDAFRILKNNTSGATPTVAMMSFLAFDAAAPLTANQVAAAAVTHCTETGIESLIMFANMAKLATALKALAGVGAGTTPTPEQLRDQVGNLTDQEAGEVAKAVAETYCQNSSTQSAEFCGEFNAATQNSSLTTEQQGCLIKRQLNPALPACP
jgi:hypothetical protein